MQALVCLPDPVGLRHLARIAGVHPHSAELALASIGADKLARQRKTRGRKLYEINRNHPDLPIVQAVFEAATRESIRVKSRGLNKKASTILPFIKQATRMLAHARSRQHVT